VAYASDRRSGIGASRGKVGHAGGARPTLSRSGQDRSGCRVQRPGAFASLFAMKVTRVLRGDFLPSRNETLLGPFEFGALNFTRTRRGISFPSRKETVSRRFAAMSIGDPRERVKRTLKPNQGRHHPPPNGGVIMAAHTISLAGALLLILLAIVFLFLVGPFGLLILIVAAVLLWYAFGPGARRINTN
jgi:hypothetical protein